MANGIKLRRGLKTALAGTIADGEFVFCTDSGELGFKKGTVEKYVDLEKLSTDIDGLQTEVEELQANTPSLLTGQFKHNVNLFYDYAVDNKPANNGNYLIPIAIVNPAFAERSRRIAQVIYFSKSLIANFNHDGRGDLMEPILFPLEYIVIESESDTYGGYSLKYQERKSSTDLYCEILNDDKGNVVVYIVINTLTSTTINLRVAFDVDCISVRGEDSNSVAYNVFLPPTGLPVISRPGQP